MPWETLCFSDFLPSLIVSRENAFQKSLNQMSANYWIEVNVNFCAVNMCGQVLILSSGKGSAIRKQKSNDLRSEEKGLNSSEKNKFTIA